MAKGLFLLVTFVCLFVSASARNDHSFAESFRSSAATGGKMETPTATDSILRFWLAPQTVHSNLPVANTFYFWASRQEIDTALRQHALLWRATPNDFTEQVYVWSLEEQQQRNEPIANHLRGADKQRIHSAWPNYWAMLGEKYVTDTADQLVQVVLMDSSYIVVFRPDEKKNRWKVFNLQGKEISMAYAMEHKANIAAVFTEGYHETVYIAPRRFKIKQYYRSFVLCNEQMIKSWHHAVPGMQEKIVQDLNYLLLLNAWMEKPEHTKGQGAKGKNCRTAWVTLTSQLPSVADYYFATQRFAWMGGRDAAQLPVTQIVTWLRLRWPKQVNMCERFPGKNPVFVPERK